jgi:hypothetical protein
MTRGLAALALALGLGGALGAGPALVAAGHVRGRLAGAPGPLMCSFRAQTGLPCLGCGGTDALVRAARADFAGAWRSNPLGAWAGAACWTLALCAGWTLATGRGAALKRASAALLVSGPLALAFAFVWWWSSLPPGALGR